MKPLVSAGQLRTLRPLSSPELVKPFWGDRLSGRRGSKSGKWIWTIQLGFAVVGGHSDRVRIPKWRHRSLRDLASNCNEIYININDPIKANLILRKFTPFTFWLAMIGSLPAKEIWRW